MLEPAKLACELLLTKTPWPWLPEMTRLDRGWKTVFEHSGKLFGKGFLLPVSLQCSNSSGMHAH